MQRVSNRIVVWVAIVVGLVLVGGAVILTNGSSDSGTAARQARDANAVVEAAGGQATNGTESGIGLWYQTNALQVVTKLITSAQSKGWKVSEGFNCFTAADVDQCTAALGKGSQVMRLRTSMVSGDTTVTGDAVITS